MIFPSLTGQVCPQLVYAMTQAYLGAEFVRKEDGTDPWGQVVALMGRGLCLTAAMKGVPTLKRGPSPCQLRRFSGV